jgi:predicted TIM-barrel fold metal-dependent hydrolase
MSAPALVDTHVHLWDRVQFRYAWLDGWRGLNRAFLPPDFVAADLKFYFGWALECSGFDRVLFGSDWAVATMATSYERWVQTVQDFLSFARDVAQIELLRTKAEGIYRV